MTATPQTAVDMLAADMLRINLEAAIRCGKAREPRLLAYHASACSSSWATFRLLDGLRAIAPEAAEKLAAELIEELNDGDYLDLVADYAVPLGVDVDATVDRIRAEFDQPA